MKTLGDGGAAASRDAHRGGMLAETGTVMAETRHPVLSTITAGDSATGPMRQYWTCSYYDNTHEHRWWWTARLCRQWRSWRTTRWRGGK
jgi:hypothetical protein